MAPTPPPDRAASGSASATTSDGGRVSMREALATAKAKSPLPLGLRHKVRGAVGGALRVGRWRCALMQQQWQQQQEREDGLRLPRLCRPARLAYHPLTDPSPPPRPRD